MPMLIKKNCIIVGLTTYHNEFLRISVPAIAGIKQKIFLIIHNDNPETTVTKSMIHSLGYRGSLLIINSRENTGLMKSRLEIVNQIPKLKLSADWMIFVDDDDILVNADAPAVAEHNFAVMQNMAVIERRLIDLFKIMDNPHCCVIDDQNITIQRPHVGMAGTLIRTNLMVRYAQVMNLIADKLQDINDGLTYRAPIDTMMWTYLTMYAKHLDPAATPIYMDQINYIATGLDSASHKYGKEVTPIINADKHYEALMKKYIDLFDNCLGRDL